MSRIAFAILFALTSVSAIADYEGAIDALNRGLHTRALAELRPLAEAGDHRAQWALGHAYRRGLGVSKDPVRADYWRRRATRDLLGQRASAPAVPLPTGRVSGSGSGLIVDERGAVLTNHHVVAGCQSLRVGNGRHRSGARIEAIERGADLALLRLEAPFGDPPARFRPSMKAVQGEPVLIAGYPLQGLLSAEMHVATGLVAALAGPRGDPNLIQLSTQVQPGSSGGPVLDARGRVIAVVAGILRSEDARLVGGVWPAAISFAVRPERVIGFLKQSGIRYHVMDSRGQADTESTIARARGFTVLVECIQ